MYNPRDFGYLENNNLISNNLKLQYYHFTPTAHYNEITGELDITYENLYKPLLYSRFELAGNIKFLFKGLDHIKFYISATPIPKYDYFEPRVEGWKYKEPTAVYSGIDYQTDTRKKFSLLLSVGYWQASRFGKTSTYFKWQPHYRVNDKLSFDFMANWFFLHNAIGYVDKNAENDSIYFGRREVVGIENVGTVKLSLSNKSSLNFRLRHYWSNVKYGGYYLLFHSVDMQDIALKNNYNINYNLFNADISYVWQFLPGNELTLVWKNYYATSNQNVNQGYFSNLSNVFSCSQLRNFSLKVIYYIDYQSTMRHLTKT